MKPVTLLSVKYAALLLIEANTQTTTLDVKKLLRSLDYVAIQDIVSDYMLQAADELPLESVSNGKFNIYTLPTPASALGPNDDDDDDNFIAIGTNFRNIPSIYVKQNGNHVNGHEIGRGYDTNDWIVTCATNNTMWFNSKYTRDEVRQAYAYLKSESFSDIRASRI